MDFHSILGKLRAIESLGTQGIDDRLHEAEGCTMTAEGEACPVHGMEECDGYQGTIQMEDSRGEMMDSDTSRDDHAERAGRKVARDIEYDERKKDGIHGAKRGAEDNKAERAGRRVTKDIEYDEKVNEAASTSSDAKALAREITDSIIKDYARQGFRWTLKMTWSSADF